jgi:hypothetical protein
MAFASNKSPEQLAFESAQKNYLSSLKSKKCMVGIAGRRSTDKTLKEYLNSTTIPMIQSVIDSLKVTMEAAKAKMEAAKATLPASTPTA